MNASQVTQLADVDLKDLGSRVTQRQTVLTQPARETVLCHSNLENNLKPKNYLVEIRRAKRGPGVAEF